MFLFISFIFGLAIGSFLNCLIYRIHEEKTILGRSYCPDCRKTISWYDNLPLLSFLFLRGRCRNCKKTISWQYPLVEMITGTLFSLALFFNPELQAFNFAFIDLHSFILLLRDWFLISTMIIIFIYDLRWYLILDIISLPSCIIILIFNLYLGIDWKNLLLASIVGGGFFLAQFLISRGRWIGGGDIRLGFLMGLALGWPKIIVALFLAYIIGSIIGLSLIWLGYKKIDSQVPFGVFLSIATIIVLFWGDFILRWYLG